jgi:hypothetical protein
MPTERTFLDTAKRRGFQGNNGKGRNCTYGQILKEVFGIDANDWHKVVGRVSRYVLLRKAVAKPRFKHDVKQ